MEPVYRHTQFGWVVIAGVAGAALVFAWQATALRLSWAWVLFALLGVVLLLFGTLRIEVWHDAVRAAFGVGLVRRTVRAGDIVSWEAVRTPWYVGWGIRLIPRGVLWNVSGFDAIELTLRSGRRFRIGTDEPEALARALETTLGARAGAGAGPPAPAGRGRARLLALAGLVAALVAGLLVVQSRPPRVTVTDAGIAIDSLFYSQRCAAGDIVSVSLEPQLPRILARTNGFAAGGTLRGHFRVERLGRGTLFVELDQPPFVLVVRREGFVAVNFADPAATHALYDELARAFPDRAGRRP